MRPLPVVTPYIAQVLMPGEPRLSGMDRFSSWQGRFRRPARVPPRRALPRRARTRIAAREDFRRWWCIALGSLAAALLIPRPSSGQGLRSQSASVSLVVTAPPRLRAGATALRRSASVADASVPIPVAPWPVARVDVRLEDGAEGDGVLAVRAVTGMLVAVTRAWIAVDGARPVAFRVIVPGGGEGASGTWRVRFRLAPADTSRLPLEVAGTVLVPGIR